MIKRLVVGLGLVLALGAAVGLGAVGLAFGGDWDCDTDTYDEWVTSPSSGYPKMGLCLEDCVSSDGDCTTMRMQFQETSAGTLYKTTFTWDEEEEGWYVTFTPGQQFPSDPSTINPTYLPIPNPCTSPWNLELCKDCSFASYTYCLGRCEGLVGYKECTDNCQRHFWSNIAWCYWNAF